MEQKIYSYDEAFQASLEYFAGDELAARVWVNKYALKDSFGNIYEKTPADMHRRLANELARIENKYENPLRSKSLSSSAISAILSLQVRQCQVLEIPSK